MKRSPLNRKTPLKAKTGPKRTGFKRKYNPEKARLERVRKKWRLKWERCMICNRSKPDHVHEIVGGNKWRHITERIPCFWLAVCRWCHSMIQNSPEWPTDRQLAHKAMHDPQGFDLLLFNRTLEKELDIPMRDVDSWIEVA